MKKLICFALFFIFSIAAFAQIENYKGNSLYRAKNVMSGNLVRSTYYNYGLTGNIGEISGEWPIGTGNEYVGDVSPLVGIEFVHPNGDTLHSVATCDGPRGNPDGPPGGGAFWGFEPLEGFNAAPAIGEDPKVAMSNQPDTWPPFWPDKMYTDPNDRSWQADATDPGWPGKWNGYFGKNIVNADQECYFQMDDHSDLEWFDRTDSLDNHYYYYPSTEDTTRRGLGLRVSVRGLQWAHFLAQDCIFWLYEITNISTHTYDKVNFGMVVGTLAGGRQDSQDDQAFYDRNDDITYSWDSDDEGSPGWVPVSETHEVGYAGYAFLESPGNPVDGIDNDNDGINGPGPTLSGQIIGQYLAPRTFNPGDPLVLIDYDNYHRTTTTFPQTGPLNYTIRGTQYQLYPGQTVQEDGRNSIDDNFNGIIDERLDHIDLKFKDYLNNNGLNNLLTDEGRDDGIDNDGDWNPLTDDVGADGLAASGDIGEGDGIPTNGEPHFDKTDVDESDQIGLSAFEYFTPPGAVRMRDDEGIWNRMAPGHYDEVSPEPADGDFVYGSGYFPLRPGQTERFSMALLFGEDFVDITDNKRTVQQVYNENYNFARPPDKPTLWVVPGNGRVTLYWDDTAERSFDPISGFDFEGYKIYRSTDPNFREVFTITDGLGRKVFHKPIAQFDLNNGNAGFFPIIRNSVIYYLGNDTGLEHSWTDSTVENGQIYYYAVVAYDRGDIEREILPAENNKTIVVSPNGDIVLDINTQYVTPRAPSAGYEGPLLSNINHLSGNATGAIGVEVIDPEQVQDNRRYEFFFTAINDTALDTDLAYSIVRHTDTASDTFYFQPQTGDSTTLKPLVSEASLSNQAERFASYYDSLFNLSPGAYTPSQYFKVAATDIYDGQKAYLLLPRQTSLIEPISGWVDTSAGLYNFRFGVTNYSQYFLTGEEYPADYQVEWSVADADTSRAFNWFNLFVLPATSVNFRVKNLTRNEYIDFAFDEANATTNGVVDDGEVLIFFEREGSNDTLVTWALEFRARAATGDTVRPANGDLLSLHLYQNFTSADRFEYTTRSARVNADAVKLDEIKVYPNPYVAASNQEPRNIFEEGRGARRLTFIHLPARCTIRIYTVRGDLVDTIEHNASIDDGMANWDLRTKDGLNAAYGTYLYHVDSPYGEKVGRFAVIK